MTEATKTQFTIRTTLLVTSSLAVYLALVRVYGFGRAIVCLMVLLLGSSSILFFVTAYYSAKEENARNMAAAILLGTLILAGSSCLGYVVFQKVPESKPAVIDQLVTFPANRGSSE